MIIKQYTEAYFNDVYLKYYPRSAENTENGELDFTYEHINTNNEIRTGICRSTPKILADGRIELLEKWKWTTRDKSKGESRIIEKI